MAEWNLNPEERAYLDALPFTAFEQMVGSMAYHWFVPRIVNDHYLILPASAADTLTNGHIPIKLAESLAFGNGAHATSALCLAALDECLQPGYSVLDLGTGSGILSIAAASSGAKSVLALDNDPVSVEAASKNVHLNAVETIVSVKKGSLNEALQESSLIGGFDLVLVNILTPVILSLLEAGVADVLKPGGYLVASGIEASEFPSIEPALKQANLSSFKTKEMESWIVVIARKLFS